MKSIFTLLKSTKQNNNETDFDNISRTWLLRLSKKPQQRVYEV